MTGKVSMVIWVLHGIRQLILHEVHDDILIPLQNWRTLMLLLRCKWARKHEITGLPLQLAYKPISRDKT